MAVEDEEQLVDVPEDISLTKVLYVQEAVTRPEILIRTILSNRVHVT